MQKYRLVLGLKHEREKMHTRVCVCVCVHVCMHTCAPTHATVQGVVISPCRTTSEFNSPLAPHFPLVRNLSLQGH